MKRMNWIWGVVIVMLVSGCADPKMRALRKAEPSANPFFAELSSRYLALAEEEARQYDWFDAVHYSDKGLAAAYGHDVVPDNPEDRSLDARFVEETHSSYETLKERLTDDAKQAHPKESAQAVTFFDCWLEQAEEGWQNKALLKRLR
jgi:OOP family OmpA-OmpF porin